MSKRTFRRIAAITLALLAAAQLAGCNSDDKPSTSTPTDTGGGGTGGGGTGGTGGGDTGGGTPGTLAEGYFIDAAVAGLSYTTSSGIAGVTDATGRYEYREGDTVTFSLGALTLGTVTAQGLVTPMTVAQVLTASTSSMTQTVAGNLLMLLQSLDANGDPKDGISLTSEIRAAVTASAVDLTAADSAFESSLTNLVASVNASANVTLTPVTRETAVAHFVSQGPASLAGIYVRADENFEPITQKAVTLTIFRNGTYLMGGQHDLPDCDFGTDSDRVPVNDLVFTDANGNGIEYGAYSWNPLTNEFKITGIIRETDGFCGLNEPLVNAINDTTVLESAPEGLVFREDNGLVSYRFVRMQREELTVAGGWIAPNGLLLSQPTTFTFFPSAADGLTGRYLMVDASMPSSADQTSPGVEEGCYAIGADGNLTIALDTSSCADAVDTNDTAGLSSDLTGLKLFIDENDRLVIEDGEEQVGLTRLPGRAITHEAMAGSWIVESAPGTAPADEARLFMLTVFEDGRFLFGTQQEDESCTPGDYPVQPLAAGGNGVEYGILSLTLAPGLVVPAEVTVDTNGECGLFHDGKTRPNGSPLQQAYFVAPNDAGDALVVWVNDEVDPAGMVFKRAPSVPNEITGAWLWTEDGATEDEFAVSAYLPGGVMFEVSTIPGAVGLLRESFIYEGTTMTSRSAGYEFCVDTQNEESNCDGDPDARVIETYVVTGDTIESDDEDGSTMTRIPAP